MQGADADLAQRNKLRLMAQIIFREELLLLTGFGVPLCYSLSV